MCASNDLGIDGRKGVVKAPEFHICVEGSGGAPNGVTYVYPKTQVERQLSHSAANLLSRTALFRKGYVTRTCLASGASAAAFPKAFRGNTCFTTGLVDFRKGVGYARGLGGEHVGDDSQGEHNKQKHLVIAKAEVMVSLAYSTKLVLSGWWGHVAGGLKGAIKVFTTISCGS